MKLRINQSGSTHNGKKHNLRYLQHFGDPDMFKIISYMCLIVCDEFGPLHAFSISQHVCKSQENTGFHIAKPERNVSKFNNIFLK